jgi:hypothetical protein
MRATTIIRTSLATGIASLLLSSCVYSGTFDSNREPVQHYVSPVIEGASQRINLDEVEKAFFSTKANDLNGWMSAFEKRVNEIYEGNEIVSIDATRETGKLQVTGFVESNKQNGYQNGEDKLFTMEQTGDVVNNELPYKISDERGYAYREGSHSIFDNPFVQAMVVGTMFNSMFGPRYYTPMSHVTVLRDHRTSFRSTPSFNSQKVANRDFSTRFKQRAVSGGIRSNNSFGRSPGVTSAPTRSWGSPGIGNSSRPFSSRGFGSTRGFSSRGWGRRR